TRSSTWSRNLDSNSRQVFVLCKLFKGNRWK
ncbi:hypothetical protein TVAGG3_0782220, partial [Trichomonas vaginalis G3]